MKPKVDGKGVKYDFRDKKTRLELIPPNFTEGMGKILTYGAEKYEEHNWMRGMRYSRLIGAIKRHLQAVEFGENLDEETNEQHLSHLGCCVAFLHYFLEHPEEYKQFDDRVYTRGAAQNNAGPTLLEVLNELGTGKTTSKSRQRKTQKTETTKKRRKKGIGK